MPYQMPSSTQDRRYSTLSILRSLGLWGTQQALTSGESVEVNEDFVRQSIMDPRSQVAQGFSPVMPQINLTEPEINALIAYVRSLGNE